MDTLSFKESGKGKAVVLLHGFCENKTLWDDFVQYLSPNYHVIALDLPGFGDSELGTDECTIEYLAGKVADFLNQQGVDQCTMIGHSLGGYVALAYAEKYGNKLEGLGLFHSTVFADSEEKQHNRNKTMDFVEKNGVEPFANNFVTPLFYHQNRKRLEKEVKSARQMVLTTPKDTILAVTKAMRDRHDRKKVIENCDYPVLYIVGKEDGAVPLEASLQQCYLPKHSVVHFLEKCGHMGMFEKKKETLTIIDTFLSLVSKQ